MISIRPAAYSDLECIYRFICSLEQTTIDYTAFGKIFNSAIRSTDRFYLVAMVDGALAGCITFHLQELLHHGGKVGEIQELYVDEKYRRKGVARLLLQHIVAIAKTQQLKSIEVTTNIVRKDAVALYHACGFMQSHAKFTLQGYEYGCLE